MTLLDLLRFHDSATLTLVKDSNQIAVSAGDVFLSLDIEDVKFNTGGAITMVHQVCEDDLPKAWAGVPVVCEACQ